MSSRHSEKMSLIASTERTAYDIGTGNKEQQAKRKTHRLHLLLTVALAGLFSLLLLRLRTDRQDSAAYLSQSTKALVRHHTTTTTSAPALSGTVLGCFQVAQPVLTPYGPSYRSTTTRDGSTELIGVSSSSAIEACRVVLMEHTFAWSYGRPFVGSYTPPSCEFNRVIINFTSVSEGRQFDRLALMYFGSTEVWRTSTAEPTQHPGITWTYVKDMTEFLLLWKWPQTLIFDLGNLIDDKYTGSFNTTLTATFFNSPVETNPLPPADLIIPISKRQGASNASSAFSFPSDNATNSISFPHNVKRAVFSVSANAQSTDEFWWSNVLETDVYTFNQTVGEMPGLSPFREVQVLIDGQIAGVQWPFPVIFTGGVVPSLHRPIVGIDAFDLREHEIDITPFLTILCDGSDHTFTILVAGLADDGNSSATVTNSVPDHWILTGKIFLWLDDDESAIATGTPPEVEFGEPVIKLSRAVTLNSAGDLNETLTYHVSVSRTVSVKATIVNSQNETRDAAWSQTLSYSNNAVVTEFGFDQINTFSIKGSDIASTGSSTDYMTQYSYPLYCNSTSAIAGGNLTIHARLTQGLDLLVQGSSVFPSGLEAFAAKPQTENKMFTGSLLSTSRDGTASFFQPGRGKKSTGFGSTNQVFRFGGFIGENSPRTVPDVELYFRNVTAINSTIVNDDEIVAGTHSVSKYYGSFSSTDGDQQSFLAEAPRAAGPGTGTGPSVFMDRGNGDTKQSILAAAHRQRPVLLQD